MPEKRISMETISCKKAIRCTIPACPCECFSPAKTCLRTCETCKHGWVAHAIQSDAYALDKLGYRHIFNMGLQVEIVQPNIVFDIASLMLYGAQATPIRLKILLDRLFSVLQHEEVLQVLHGFGWSYEDYARGYILQNEDHPSATDTGDQEASGRVLDKWVCATREEEYIIMQQFLRFGETKSIAQEIILQDTKERQDQLLKQSSGSESDIKKFIDRSNMTLQNLVRPFDVRHLFGARLPFVGTTPNRLMSPPIPGFSTPSSSPRGDMRPPLISVSASSPVTSTPLGRLQTMQPFDYRRESASPLAVSPGDRQSSTRESSPKSDSPQNLSLTSTSSTTPPPHAPFTPHSIADMTKTSPMTHMPVIPQSIALGAPSMILPTLPTHHSTSDGVINFSIKEEIDRKNKHLRKPSNPIKRNWIPDANFGSPMIGPNGKKRVLCTACNKTFCDKGALKIHYSAVHLKEMHKCSVDGCTMMFSSRRSRNRHSANPNPKLHMPQKRPKIPEGATVVDDGSGANQKRPISSPPPSLVLNQSMMTRSPVNLMDGSDSRSFYGDSIQMPVFPSALKRLKLDEDDSDDSPKDLSLPISRLDGSREASPRNLSLPIMKHDLGTSSDPLDIDTPSKESQDGSASDGEKMETMATNSPSTHRSQNRRKNIPTRCAQPTDIFRVTDHIQDKGDSENKDKLDATIKLNGSQEGRSEDGFERKVCAEDNDVEMEDYSDRGDSKLVIDDEEDDDDIDKNDTGEILDFSMNALDMSESENVSVVSGHESDTGSYGSNDSSDISKTVDDVEIPMNKDNPKQCVTCGKTFLNVFGVKIHYKNVHLKLMHTCNVEGCTASFPSKRSRDRHSANLYLHRKLLSTSEDQKSKDETDDNQNFRADVIQKLYQFQNPTENQENEEIVNGKSEEENKAVEEDPDKTCDELDVDKTNGAEDEDEIDDLSGDGMVTCHICNIQVRDNLVLKEHFELNHPKEMYHCTIKGCEKVFSTRKSRNRHSQNHNLHKSVSPNGRAITV